MLYEVEVKFQVDYLEDIEYFLIEQKAELVEMVMQVDYYFNHPSRDFSSTDEALRVRQEGDKFYLTYKGPKIDSATKTRKEIEFGIEDKEKMIDILESLSFSKALIVSKERRIFKLNQLIISLDAVDSLGNFVEIEQSVNKKSEIQKSKKMIFKLAENMNLNPKSNIRKSYMELILEKNK